MSFNVLTNRIGFVGCNLKSSKMFTNFNYMLCGFFLGTFWPFKLVSATRLRTDVLADRNFRLFFAYWALCQKCDIWVQILFFSNASWAIDSIHAFNSSSFSMYFVGNRPEFWGPKFAQPAITRPSNVWVWVVKSFFFGVWSGLGP